MKYLITGLPRSKTAWMSVVASTVAGSFCFHEPMKRHKSWACCFDLWTNPHYAHLGIADAHLAFYLSEIIERENPRILVIRRDIEEVKASLRALGGPQTNYAELLAAKLDQFIAHPAVAWVDFHALQHLAVVRQCLQFLMPSAEVDERRIAELIELNVQVETERVWQYAMQHRTQADQILGSGVMAGLNLSQ